MRAIWLSFLLAFALPLSAQIPRTNNTASRYLLIVDKSAAMKRYASATQKAVENLLRSSLNAQLQPGDTLGVWTFDEELHAGRFPLQQWSPEQAVAIASNVVAFLRAEPNQKQSRYEVVAPALEQVVRNSYRLTVLLVSDGDEKISGTPFDREIQNSFAQNFKAQQKAHMPFITVLRASRGQFRNASVTLAPWPVEFPAFPPEPEIVESPKPKPPEKKVPSASPAPRPKAPPLIVRGEKAASPPATNTPSVAKAEQTETTPAPANASLRFETSNRQVTPISVPTNPGESKTLAAPDPSPPATESATQPSATASPKPAPVSEAAVPSTVAPVTTATAKNTELSASAPIESKPSTALGKAPAEESVAPPPARPPVNRPPDSTPAAPSPVTSAPAAADSHTSGDASIKAPAPIALAFQPEPGLSRLGMAGIGIAVLLLAGGFYFVLHRRARHVAQASLITRSLDQNLK